MKTKPNKRNIRAEMNIKPKLEYISITELKEVIKNRLEQLRKAQREIPSKNNLSYRKKKIHPATKQCLGRRKELMRFLRHLNYNNFMESYIHKPPEELEYPAKNKEAKDE